MFQNNDHLVTICVVIFRKYIPSINIILLFLVDGTINNNG